jgi:hypothetical protein
MAAELMSEAAEIAMRRNQRQVLAVARPGLPASRKQQEFPAEQLPLHD